MSKPGQESDQYHRILPFDSSQLKILNETIVSQKEATIPEVDEQKSKSSSQFFSLITSIFIQFLIVLICIGRAISCTYRYKTTDDAQRLFFELPFINLINEPFISILIPVFASLFFVTDAFLTNVNLKKSFNEFLKIKQAIKKNMMLLKNPETERLTACTILDLTIIMLLMPGSMYGAFLKGKVGVHSIVEQFSDHPSFSLSATTSTIAYFSGGSSAICAFVFQFDQALLQMRIAHALRNENAYDQYWKNNRCAIYRSYFITFVISVAVGFITMLSAFYDRGNFDPELLTILKAAFIAISNIILNTRYTTARNFHHTSIQAKYQKQLRQNNQLDLLSCIRNAGIFAIKSVGVISSTGNSLAVYPAIMHLFLLCMNEKSVADAPLSINITGLTLLALLFLPMFWRDFFYYAKQAESILCGDRKGRKEESSPVSVENETSPFFRLGSIQQPA